MPRRSAEETRRAYRAAMQHKQEADLQRRRGRLECAIEAAGTFVRDHGDAVDVRSIEAAVAVAGHYRRSYDPIAITQSSAAIYRALIDAIDQMPGSGLSDPPHPSP